MKKTVLIIFSCLYVSVSGYAQSKDWGYVSASLESLHHIYADDNPDIYATNNYLKADYYKGRFSAGLQLEGYFPATVGYPLPANRMSLSNFYVDWRDRDYSVTVGTFYEQLGSGLLFRSWEDRVLGVNNALLGARVAYAHPKGVAVRLFAGIPRFGKLGEYEKYKEGNFFGLGLAEGIVNAGADLSVSLSDLLSWEKLSWSLEASLLYRYEKFSDVMLGLGMKPNALGWSGRTSLNLDGFYFNGEWVGMGNQLTTLFKVARGNAQLVELGYNAKGLGVSVTGRRLYRMNGRLFSDPVSGRPGYESPANLMAYCPAMCTQHTYMLANLHPYSPLVGNEDLRPGEIGGQIDAFYNFRRGTVLGGKRGMKVHANFASYWSLDAEGGVKDTGFLFRDFSVDIEKQWTKKFKMTLLYSLQDYNKSELNHEYYDTYIGMSHVVVADLLYKWTTAFSTRLELQYLASKGYQKDWMAALLELGFAPHWSVFASDMYNHGDSGIHYYNAGVSFAMRYFRVAVGYGKYRAGYICSGGVCRKIPAYTGANITLTASF